jgi:hypothetical protein
MVPVGTGRDEDAIGHHSREVGKILDEMDAQ